MAHVHKFQASDIWRAIAHQSRRHLLHCQGAEDARARVRRGGTWADGQVILLTPADSKTSRRGIMAKKMEPESRGIWRTILRAHLFTAFVGIAVGVGALALLVYTGNGLIGGSPGPSFIAFAFFGTVFGLMLGGLISLRPAHARLITVVRSGCAFGPVGCRGSSFQRKAGRGGRGSAASREPTGRANSVVPKDVGGRLGES